MKTKTLLLRGSLLPALYLFIIPAVDAATTVLFKDAGDLDAFFITESAQSGVDLVDLDDSTLPLSQLDGDALRLWDFDSAGRTTLRYRDVSGNTDGMQLSFDAYIDPESEGNLVVRIGNYRPSMAGIRGAGFSLVIDSSGTIRAEHADLISGGSQSESFSGHAERGLPFNVSMVLNTSLTDDLEFLFGETYMALGPQLWALFVDGKLLATDLSALSPESTGDSSFNYVPEQGVSEIWWLTGTTTPANEIDMQLDNIYLKTGSDIAVAGGEVEAVSSYAGYPVNAGGYAYTVDWLGLINVRDAPWIWSYHLGSWFYMEEPAADAVGAWIHIPGN